MLSAVPLARARMVVFADVELFNVEFAHNSCFGKCLYELSATYLLNQKIIARIFASAGEKTYICDIKIII